MSAPVVLVAELPGAQGGVQTAAALATALTLEGEAARSAAVVTVEVGAGRSRGPTMLASEGARRTEDALQEAGFDCAARGRLAWVHLDPGTWIDGIGRILDVAAHCSGIVVSLPAPDVGSALHQSRLAVAGVVLRAEIPRDLPLAALAVAELGAQGVRVRIATRAPGRVASRRALAGIDPGGEVSRRATRLVRGLIPPRSPGRDRRSATIGSLAAEGGQALPLLLAGALALVAVTLGLAALSGAVTGTSRAQRAADLVAVSTARSMRDDFDRLFVSARRPDGSLDPRHLEKSEYLARARAAARQAASRNGVGARRVRLEFPDAGSFAPMRARVVLDADLEAHAGESVQVSAEARAVPASPSAAPDSASPAPVATGGGYSGPLEFRQGEGMRPDVAEAFDRMAAAAARAGVPVIVSDGFRSDAEQAVLWAENPDPRWVAPPGTSLHRCATELDLGPPAAYGWLAANAPRFGFVQRYAWEAWHYGYGAGPAPCSAASETADGEAARTALPAFVPARFRAALATAAGTWNVGASLLAAQLMAESNFNPYAVSSAGAAGIAQFMPATAAAYGLADPYDAEAAIDAQAHLMSDLLGQFGDPALALAAYNAGPAPVEACDCVPAIPETQAYVARILALVDDPGAVVGAGGSAEPPLEVRLVD